MERQEIIELLCSNGVKKTEDSTMENTYSDSPTIDSLVKAVEGNRLQAGWKKAQYIVAKYKNTGHSLSEILEGWKTVVAQYRNQYLLLEYAQNKWRVYDSECNEIALNELFHTKPIGVSPSLQQIFYGAPGTGKSYHVKEVMARAANVRTTFHPDSDYSTFVGAYKPTMKRVPIILQNGTKMEEEQIVYQFVPQAFLKAYVGAWRNLDEPFYLVIEEINRGNCAQVFGDLFQLLDREADGYSAYPIDADDDIRRYLGEVAFADLTDEQREAIGREDIIKGERLLLPPNLHIWATMNTSDQSLFPIDSAFKRRWDWTYMPINDARKGWKIVCGENRYDWWQFLEAVNDKVGKTTDSEDKKLGYFFVQADGNGEISAERFVGKVVFYLWNDVFRDYGFDDQVFAAADGGRLTFQKFFQADGTPDLGTMERFLTNLGLESETDTTDEEQAE